MSTTQRKRRSTSKAPLKRVPFDAVRYLGDDEAIADYLTAALGMAQVAKDAGSARENLYKALAPGAKPRFGTVMKVTRSVCVRLAVRPAA